VDVEVLVPLELSDDESPGRLERHHVEAVHARNAVRSPRKGSYSAVVLGGSLPLPLQSASLYEARGYQFGYQ